MNRANYKDFHLAIKRHVRFYSEIVIMLLVLDITAVNNNTAYPGLGTLKLIVILAMHGDGEFLIKQHALVLVALILPAPNSPMIV